MKKFLLFSFIVVMVSFIVSCTKTADAVGNMIGTWHRTVNNVNFTLYIPDSSHFSYTATINGSPFLASGHYSFLNGQASFVETSGSANCTNIVGTYTYAATTATLTLTAGTDNCGGSFASRATIFT